MIIESGLIVAAGLLFTFLKCPWRIKMWMLSNPLKMDIFIFVLLNALHWGTFSGVMVAATGALVCSGLLTLGQKICGIIKDGKYHAGFINIQEKLV